MPPNIMEKENKHRNSTPLLVTTNGAKRSFMPTDDSKPLDKKDGTLPKQPYSKDDDDKDENTVATFTATPPPSPPSHTIAKHTNRHSTWVLAGLLSVPLTISVVLVLATVFTHHLYLTYYRPMIKATERTADVDSLAETDMTYYHSKCTRVDLSIGDSDDPDRISGPGLILDTNSMTGQQAMEHHMLHGVSILPEVLSLETANRLHAHVMRRNENLTEKEFIYITPALNRRAFALDPTEDESVVAALQEVASHRVLREMLELLVGPDPALTELSAITNYPGAPIQHWHHDVLNDGGSAVKFARTYSHSYTIFIALQDTVLEMGPTRVCPGTHYCAEEENKICEDNGLYPTEAYPDGVWPMGDAVIFNQQISHHAGAHVGDEDDESTPPRAMFILSFNSRPQVGRDSRVLAFGLYCLALPSIWGLTWQDLYDPVRYMGAPYRYLRSFAIYKSADRNWGLDFLHKSVLEWTIGENGMTSEDLQKYAESMQETIGFPEYLHGPISEEEGNYEAYIDTTMENFLEYFVKVHLCVVSVSTMIFFLWSACVLRGRPSLKPVAGLFVVSYVVPSLLMFGQMWRVRESDWGRTVRSGMAFRAPFPDQESYVRTGPTTEPERVDVLIGTRFDTTYLGAYEQWLDYHPGNRGYRDAVAKLGGYFVAYEELPTVFQDEVVNSVAESMSGRMLEQDWRSGDWVIMSPTARDLRIRFDFQNANSRRRERLSKLVDRLLARYRFEVSFRETALASHSQTVLINMRTKLFSSSLDGSSRSVGVKGMIVRPGGVARNSRLHAWSAGSRLTTILINHSMQLTLTAARNHSRWTNIPELDHVYHVGDMVVVELDGQLWRGAVYNVRHGIDKSSAYSEIDIAFEDGIFMINVPLDRIFPLVPLQDGDLVFCITDADDDFLRQARVTRVTASGVFDIMFSNGEEAYNIPRGRCGWDLRRRSLVWEEDDDEDNAIQ